MKLKTTSAILFTLAVFIASGRAQDPRPQKVKQSVTDNPIPQRLQEQLKLRSEIRSLMAELMVEKAALRNALPEDLINYDPLRDPQVREYQQRLDQLRRELDDLQKTNAASSEAQSAKLGAERETLTQALQKRRQEIRTQTEKELRELLQQVFNAREAEVNRLARRSMQLQTEVDQLRAGSKPVTAPSPAHQDLLVHVYPLRDFTDGDALLRVITTTIQPQSWADRGGAATAVYFGEAKSLVIKQSAEAHKEIQELLGALRDAKQGDRPK